MLGPCMKNVTEDNTKDIPHHRQPEQAPGDETLATSCTSPAATPGCCCCCGCLALWLRRTPPPPPPPGSRGVKDPLPDLATIRSGGRGEEAPAAGDSRSRNLRLALVNQQPPIARQHAALSVQLFMTFM